MKKILSLFAILLFAGNVLAADKTDTYVFTSRSWAATLDETTANWTSGKDGTALVADGVKIVSDANATSPIAYENVNKVVVAYSTGAYSEGTIGIKIGTNDIEEQAYVEDAEDGDLLVFNFATPQSGVVKLEVNVTDADEVYIKSVAITYEYNSAVSEILANKLDLGTKIIAVGNDSYSSDETIEVTGSNLSEAITVTYTSDYFDVDESSLSTDGGTLNLHVYTASAVAFADTIYLTSGAILTKVPVVAKIKKNDALAGTAVTLNPGASVPVTVDGIDAVRVGSNTQGGSMTITVPAYATKLRFYAVAWADAPGTITLSAPDGVGLSATQLTLLDDAGFASTAVSLTLDALTHTAFAHEITLTGVSAQTQITVASGSINRFVIWGAKCDIVEPDKNYTVNYLAKDGTPLDDEVVTLNLPDAPIIAGFSFDHWKVLEGNIADGINIQAVYKSTATEAPAVVVNPANPSQKLIRDGNVYILHDNHTYTLTGTKVH